MHADAFLNWLEKPSRPPLVMGVLNITPDSFSDGGAFLSVEQAFQRAKEMIEEGVDIIDVGGESSRPGAQAISVQIELDRVIPVIQCIRAAWDVCISVDTYKPQVMLEAIKAGASFINDIYALRIPGALDMALSLRVPI